MLKIKNIKLIKSKVAVIVLISLPFALLLSILSLVKLSYLFIKKPSVDYIYSVTKTSCGDSFIFADGSILKTNNYNGYLCDRVTSRLYYYESSENKSREITSEEVSDLSLYEYPKSKEGYIFTEKWDETIPGIDLGYDYRPNFLLKKNYLSFKQNINKEHYETVSFLSWVEN